MDIIKEGWLEKYQDGEWRTFWGSINNFNLEIRDVQMNVPKSPSALDKIDNFSQEMSTLSTNASIPHPYHATLEPSFALEIDTHQYPKVKSLLSPDSANNPSSVGIPKAPKSPLTTDTGIGRESVAADGTAKVFLENSKVLIDPAAPNGTYSPRFVFTIHSNDQSFKLAAASQSELHSWCEAIITSKGIIEKLQLRRASSAIHGAIPRPSMESRISEVDLGLPEEAYMKLSDFEIHNVLGRGKYGMLS